jgi:hypothetical protein
MWGSNSRLISEFCSIFERQVTNIKTHKFRYKAMVNHNNIFKKIGYILNELQDQYQFLSENPEQLSELELELFLANANFLADHIQIVKKLAVNQPVRELPEASPKEDVIKQNSYQEKVIPPVYNTEENRKDLITDVTPNVENTPTFEFVLNDRSPEDTVDLEEVIADNHHEEQVDVENQEAEDIEEYDNEVTYVAPAIDEVGPEPFLVYNEVEDVEPEPEIEQPMPEPEPEIELPMPEPEVEQTRFEPQVQQKATEPDVEQKAPEPQVEQRKPESEPEPIKHPEPVVHYQQPAPVLVPDNLKAKEIPEPSPALVPDKVEEKIIQPNAAAPRPTLNDILAAASQKSGSYNQDRPAPAITDLKKAVNLNEKLLYIKDLFNGYNLAYSEAIDIINKLPDFRSADNFLQNNYAVKNNWQAKQTTVDKFYELLRQRFPEA